MFLPEDAHLHGRRGSISPAGISRAASRNSNRQQRLEETSVRARWHRPDLASRCKAQAGYAACHCGAHQPLLLVLDFARLTNRTIVPRHPPCLINPANCHSHPHGAHISPAAVKVRPSAACVSQEVTAGERAESLARPTRRKGDRPCSLHDSYGFLFSYEVLPVAFADTAAACLGRAASVWLASQSVLHPNPPHASLRAATVSTAVFLPTRLPYPEIVV